VQATEAGALMLRGSGSALHGSAPPECDGRTMTRTVHREQGAKRKFVQPFKTFNGSISLP